MWMLIGIPILFAVLRLITKKYAFSALTTLACAAIVAPRAPILTLGLIVSCVGDYFLGHKNGRDEVYAIGISCFFLGHALFLADALGRMRTLTLPLILGGCMLAGYAADLILRVLPGMPPILKLPGTLYMIISVAGFTCAMMTGDPVYIAAIFALVFSDTMIAENDFCGTALAGPLILPTYYLCHILIALSALLR